MCTVQAPHCASPQPKRGPFSARPSRSAYRSGMAGSSRSTSEVLPLTVSVTFMAWLLGGLGRPGRSADHAAEVAALESRILVRENVGLDVAERGVRLVPDAVVEGLDDVFLEAIAARMRIDHRVSLLVAVFGIGEPEHVHLHACRH